MSEETCKQMVSYTTALGVALAFLSHKIHSIAFLTRLTSELSDPTTDLMHTDRCDTRSVVEMHNLHFLCWHAKFSCSVCVARDFSLCSFDVIMLLPLKTEPGTEFIYEYRDQRSLHRLYIMFVSDLWLFSCSLRCFYLFIFVVLLCFVLFFRTSLLAR